MQGRSRLPFLKEATEEEENLPSLFFILLKCFYKCSLKSPLGTFFSGYVICKEPEPFRFAVRSSAVEISRVQGIFLLMGRKAGFSQPTLPDTVSMRGVLSSSGTGRTPAWVSAACSGVPAVEQSRPAGWLGTGPRICWLLGTGMSLGLVVFCHKSDPTSSWKW